MATPENAGLQGSRRMPTRENARPNENPQINNFVFTSSKAWASLRFAVCIGPKLVARLDSDFHHRSVVATPCVWLWPSLSVFWVDVFAAAPAVVPETLFPPHDAAPGKGIQSKMALTSKSQNRRANIIARNFIYTGLSFYFF